MALLYVLGLIAACAHTAFVRAIANGAANIPGLTTYTSIATVVEVVVKHNRWPPLSQPDYEQLISNGGNLIGAMESEDELAVTFFRGKSGTIQSPYINYPKDLENWGYRYDSEGNNDFHFGTGPDIGDAMRGLGVDYTMAIHGGTTFGSCWKHNQPVTRNGKTYRPTQAVFSQVINVEHGLLVGWQKFGPKYMGARQQPPVTGNALPELRAWADIIFLEWLNRAQTRNADASKLKYIVSGQIQNLETERILQRILDVDDVRARCRRFKWDNRKEYGVETDEAKALLASQNGRGAALLLIRHKGTFGSRTAIEKVTFWCGGESNERDIHLLFTVKKRTEANGFLDKAERRAPRHIITGAPFTPTA
ncbi:hypothetical protein BDV95DRAFT_80334 [Massariosphaeria phaeospora]|uniref:Jacalin-type lectin domain-containing protein n=1 Tax=Massariosphaeria phaeospora TaxID=100035 RepID=A0A7C8IC57_9PLEO|nr:hypothetical protein BDV95DRAFT_80334 [Massariosphaeria phaeospora]